MSATPKFDSVDKKWMLRNTIRLLDLSGSRVLGFVVAEICGTGGGTGFIICRELGWNPDHTLKEFFTH